MWPKKLQYIFRPGEYHRNTFHSQFPNVLCSAEYITAVKEKNIYRPHHTASIQNATFGYIYDAAYTRDNKVQLI